MDDAHGGLALGAAYLAAALEVTSRMGQDQVKMRISWPRGSLVAMLSNTPTSRKLLEILPCEARANTWGEEVYFSLPMAAKLEPDARQVVDAGTVCFWVQGGALALPFGPTPVSQGDECRLVTKVNVLGKIDGEARVLESVRDGDSIQLELADKND